MRTRGIVGSVGVALLCLSGCLDGPVGDPDHAGEEVERTEEAQQSVGLCGQGSYLYGWANNGGSTRLWTVASSVCWLTKAGGRFDGNKGTNVGVSVEPRQDGYWWLVTRGAEEHAEAHCLARSCFTGDGVNDVVWVSTANYSSTATADGSSCDTNSSYAWWGDAATIEQAWPGITGPGRTEGGAEYAEIIQSSNPYGSSIVRSGDCQSDGLNYPIRSHGTSLFVGTPSGGKAAHFSASGAVWGNYTQDTQAYVDESICYFTHIHGKFRGGGESVKFYQQLEPSTGRYKWMLQTTQGSSGSSVYAGYKCYFHNQWDL